MKCQNCGFEHEKETKFCTHCGAPNPAFQQAPGTGAAAESRPAGQQPAPWGTAGSGAQPPAPWGTAGSGAQQPASWGTAGSGAQPPASWGTAGSGAQPPAPWGTAGSGAQPPAPWGTAGSGAQPPAPVDAAGSGAQQPAPWGTAGSATQPVTWAAEGPAAQQAAQPTPAQPPLRNGQQTGPRETATPPFASQPGGGMTPPPPVSGPGRGSFPPSGVPPQPGRKAGRKPPGKRRTGLIVGLSTGAAVLLAFILLLFPRRIRYESEDDPTTKQARMPAYSISISCNQGVREVYYALNPSDPMQTDRYRPVSRSGSALGGFFNKTVSLRNLNLKPGNNTLYLCTNTLFGRSAPQKFVLTRMTGYAGRVDPDAAQKLNDETAIAGNELIVVMERGSARREIERIAAEYGADIIGELPLIDEYQLRFSDPNLHLALIRDRLLTEPNVTMVLYNFIYKFEPSDFVSDRLFDSWDLDRPDGNNWSQEAMRVPAAYDQPDSIGRIAVGVIDGSVQYDHEDLQIPMEHVYINPSRGIRNMQDLERYRSKRANRPGQNYMDLLNHGTHVSGIIGALANNGLGIAGVNRDVDLYFYHYWHFDLNPDTREIIYYENSDPEISTMEFHASLVRLIEDGCRVINLSIGSAYPTTPEDCYWEPGDTAGFGNLCTKLEQQGYDFLLFKAAGNSGDDAANYSMNRVFTGTEAGRRHTVIVGSVENTPVSPESFSNTPHPARAGYDLSYFSNRGDLVDVAAPGSDIFSTVAYNAYEWLDGTSMAAPGAAGVASLIYAINPQYSSTEVKRILMNETDIYSPDRGGRAIPVVNAAMSAELAERDSRRSNLLEAEVLDAETREQMDHFLVTVSGASGWTMSARFTNGAFSMAVPPDTYRLSFASDGYAETVLNNVAASGDGSTLQLPRVMMRPLSGGTDEPQPTNPRPTAPEPTGPQPGESQPVTGGAGVIVGQTLNAMDGEALAGVRLRFYTGTDTGGQPAGEATSVADGSYRIELPAGRYTMVGEKTGYITNQTAVESVRPSAGNQPSQNLILSPNITSDQVRFVLSWGETPHDLDLHLRGPGENGDDYGHVYWWNSKYEDDAGVCFELDVDDQESYGPETITIQKEKPGEYIVYVHDYTNSLKEASDGLGQSGATVTAYLPTGVQTFKVPNEPGTLWIAFKYANGVITPINRMVDEMFEDDVPKHGA